ncbi:GNAT family N-acetyltransferase [Jeotgalibacillus campisalis]|uniref:N-acetyltransferase domain-containing protein n=1 Tax=Jeotgalibacillus campisalis TaxID=220754 RepID=A0A0C2V209_9BACL|nr:GNAT family protein [Jeotgalibacillus campisalis]KIL43082.1 hypothetical protein KR50_34850 [Jeotgalibacillus campisalis]
MSKLSFKKYENEVEDLVSLLTKNKWEFHSNPAPVRKEILKKYRDDWHEKDKEIFWIESVDKKIGLIMLHDLTDSIPLFDLRLENNSRGKGFGSQAVCWITDYIFKLPDNKIRIEAYTRSDHIAMRKTLSKCGFVKEGYLRQSCENADGSVSDSVCYAIIRSDWENKITTPIKLNDLPF